MSGTNPTYSMNTISRIVIVILHLFDSLKVDPRDYERLTTALMRDKKGKGIMISGRKVVIGGCVSGDDEVTTGDEETIIAMSRNSSFLHRIGFPRKNVPENVEQPIVTELRDAEFCSHTYERITYFDESNGKIVERWQPTRSVPEIVAKSSIRLGTGDEMSDEAWLSAQGNNLLVNYHHMRTCRAVGLSYKAVVRPNILLTDTGGFLKPTPWMRSGEILEVINTVLFGDSTHYPVQDFKVRKFSHLGYLPIGRETVYDENCFSPERARWRRGLHNDVAATITTYGTGGDEKILNEWRTPDCY